MERDTLWSALSESELVEHAKRMVDDLNEVFERLAQMDIEAVVSRRSYSTAHHRVEQAVLTLHLAKYL